jgi:hypothetical protein
MDKSETQVSSVRGGENAYKAEDAEDEYAGAFDGFGGDNKHGHTVSTGFLAKITAGGNAISNVRWHVESTPSDTNPVYVRAKTDSNGSWAGIQISKDATYSDGSDVTEYAIYKADNNQGTKTFNIKDSGFPMIAANTTVYIGLIIDQLYDQNATANLYFDQDGGVDVDNTTEDAAQSNGTATSHRMTITASTNTTFTEIASGTYGFGEFYNADNTDIIAETLSNDGMIKLLADDHQKDGTTTYDHNISVKSGNWTLAEANVVKEDGVEKVVPVTGSDLGTFTTRIQLNGTGKPQNGYRAVAVKLKAGQTLSVYAASANSSSNRTLVIGTLNEKNKAVALTETDVPAEQYDNPNSSDKKLLVGVATYTATEDGTYYIYSKSSGINLYAINVTGD